MTLILVGFMGVGKSTVAQVLARQYQYSQIDNDDFLCQREQQSISELFANYGEAGFRERELAACRAAVAQRPDVLALGGGIIETAASRTFLQQQPHVIWLQSDFATCWQRIRQDQQRPLVQTLQQSGLAQRFRQRQPWYQAVATTTIAVGAHTPEELATLLVQQFDGRE